MKPRHLFAKTITGLEVGCIVGVLCFGARILPAEPAPVPIDAAPRLDEAPGEAVETRPAAAAPEFEAGSASSLGLWTEVGAASTRIPCAGGSRETRELDSSAQPVAAERRKERDYYQAFVGLGAQGTAAIESAARMALAGQGPDCEKVAALRALVDSNAPSAFDLHADAIASLPDVCRGQSDSVPRFALRGLVARAAREDRAREALERVIWNRSLSSDLRCVAVAGLAAASDASGAWRIVNRLEMEQDERVRQSAARALACNPAAESAAQAAAQWIPPSPDGGDVGDQHE